MQSHGGIHRLWTGATASQERVLNLKGFNSVIIWHLIEDATTGGYVKVHNEFGDGESDGLPHPAPAGDSLWGLNVVDEDQTDPYVMVVRGISERVQVELSVTDGKHTVILQPANL